MRPALRGDPDGQSTDGTYRTPLSLYEHLGGFDKSMNPFRWALQSARQRGIIRTTRIAGSLVLDLLFDLRYGTDTLRWVETRDLEVASGADHTATHHRAPYRATKARPFLKLLRELGLPRDSVFVDIGSGKGRVLLIASQYGFRKMVGVEFSARLCAVARKNVARFAEVTDLAAPIEVIEADAALYQFRRDESVLFMFNPFDAYIMGKVVQNIGRSIQEHPRPIWVIYNTPRYHDVLSASGLFETDTFYEIGGNHFRVYRNAVPASVQMAVTTAAAR